MTMMSQLIRVASCCAAITCLVSTVSLGDARVVWDNGGAGSSFGDRFNWRTLESYPDRNQLPGYRLRVGNEPTNAIMQGNTFAIVDAPFQSAYWFSPLILRAGSDMVVNADLDLCVRSVQGDTGDSAFLVGQLDSSTGQGVARWNDDLTQNSGTICADNIQLNTGVGSYTINGGSADLSRYLFVYEGAVFHQVGDTASVNVGLNLITNPNNDGKPTLAFTAGPNGINPVNSDLYVSINPGTALDVDVTAMPCLDADDEIPLLTAAGSINGRFSTTPVVGSRVEVVVPGCCLEIAELQVWSSGQNVALSGSATHNPLWYNNNGALLFPPSNAIDGNINTFQHTRPQGGTHTWSVDLGGDVLIDEVTVNARINFGTTFSRYTLNVYDSTGALTFTTGSGVANRQRILEDVHRYQFVPNVVGLGEQGTGWELVQHSNQIALRVLEAPNKPTAEAGDDILVPCGHHDETHPDHGSNHGVAVLDGTLSTDPQNDIVSYVWDIDGTVLGSGSTLEVELDHVGPGPETTYTINLTVTDSTGCSSTDTVAVTVYDNHEPAIVGGRNLTRQCTRRGGSCGGDGYFPGGNQVPRYVPWKQSNSIRATDNCDGLVGLTVTRANPDGSSYTATYYNDGTKVGTSSDIAAIESNVVCVGNTYFYYSTTDLSGNSVTAQRRLRVIDTRRPTISCPANAQLPCSWDSADLSPAALGSATATDRCSSSPAITYSDGAVQVDECGLRSFSRTWTATDNFNNSASCVQQIQEADNTIPVLTLTESNSVVTCNQAFDPLGGVTASDECDSNPTLEIIGDDVDTTTPGVYDFEIVATDCSGNSVNESRVLNVAYAVEGLLAPLNNQDLAVLVSAASSGESLNLDCSNLKNIKAKRGGLPLKIRLSDCSGQPLTTELLNGLEPKVTRILALDGDNAVEELVDVVVEDTGNSNPDGVMRISDDKWIYTLDVDESGLQGYGPGCYVAEFEISLPDNGTVYVYGAFKLK